LFAVYVVVLLVTLVFLGSVSDYLGRRPVMLAALALGAVASGLFLLGHGIGLLFAGRALQGVAVGLISETASAALLDLRPESGSHRSFPARRRQADRPSGQSAPAPTHLDWWLLVAAFIIGIVALLGMPEPGTVRAGVVSSLRPRVTVPQVPGEPLPPRSQPWVGVWPLAGF
jgi:hypothetical protein